MNDAIYRQEHKTGIFYAENHGADVAGVYYKSKRMKKAKYIATAKVSEPDSIRRRIEWYIGFAGLDAK